MPYIQRINPDKRPRKFCPGRGLAITTLIAAIFLSPPALLADTAKTKGGLEIVSEDGNYSASLGGRIHFDYYGFDSDVENPISTTDFRRARITMKGHIHEWRYILEQDYTGGDSLSGFRDVYFARKLFNGEIRFGQFKPFRSMAEMTSSNEITFMERPFSSSTGLYAGNQFQQGVGWTGVEDCVTLGFMAFNLRDAGTRRNEGLGASGRVAWAPINTDMQTLHLGTAISYENANQNSPDLVAEADYAGRRGPAQLMALTPGDFGGDASTLSLELAGSYGPFYVQSEFVIADFEGGYYISESDFIDEYGAPPPFFCDPDFGCFIDNQTIQTWYIQGSWMLSGEHKTYNQKRGAFNSAKPSGDGLWGGAWELTARYDTMENRDIDRLDASSAILGLNYYVNNHVRFMLNLIIGEDDFTGDNINQLGIRAQMRW